MRSDEPGGAAIAHYSQGRGLALLWFALLAGPLGWSIDLIVGFVLARPACEARSRVMLYGLTTLTLALVALGGWAATRIRSDLETDPETPRAAGAHRALFMARSAVIICLAFALVIAATAIPRLVHQPCD